MPTNCVFLFLHRSSSRFVAIKALSPFNFFLSFCSVVEVIASKLEGAFPRGVASVGRRGVNLEAVRRPRRGDALVGEPRVDVPSVEPLDRRRAVEPWQRRPVTDQRRRGQVPAVPGVKPRGSPPPAAPSSRPRGEGLSVTLRPFLQLPATLAPEVGRGVHWYASTNPSF